MANTFYGGDLPGRPVTVRVLSPGPAPEGASTLRVRRPPNGKQVRVHHWRR